MSSREVLIEGVCLFYEANGECHNSSYIPGVGFVSEPSLLEYHTGGSNFIVNRDAWCKARHDSTEWRKRRVLTALVEAQKLCTRYKKGWPRTKDGQEIYDENGEWVREIDEEGNFITKRPEKE